MSIYGLARPHTDENGRRRDLQDGLEYTETEAALWEREKVRRLWPAPPVVRYDVPQIREER